MGGGSNPQTRQTTTFEMSPEQNQLFGMMMPYASQFANKPLQQWQGPTVAGFTPLQESAQAGATGVSAPAGMTLGQQAAGAASNILSPSTINIAQNPQFQGMSQSITDLANRNLMQNILPAVRSGSTVAGGQYAGGGTREGLAEGKAIGDTAIGTNSAISQLASAMYGQGLGAMGAMAQGIPGVQASQLFGPEVQSAVGGQQQNLAQQQLNQQIAQFYGGQELPFLQSQDIMSLITGMPGGSNVSTGTGAVPPTSPWNMALGGAAGLGAISPFLNWAMPTAAGATSGLAGLGSGISSMFSGLGGLFGGGGAGAAAAAALL